MSRHLTPFPLPACEIFRTSPPCPLASARRWPWLACLLLLGLVGCAKVPTPPREASLPTAAELYRALATWQATTPDAPAVTVAIVGPLGSPRLAASGGEGAASRLADPPLPVASVTKVLVALVALQLEAEGRWSLDDPADQWVDGELAAPPFDAPPPTLRELLSHTAGVRDPAAGHSVGNEPIRPLTPSGVTFAYSNQGYGLLAHAIAKADKRPWQQCVEQRVLAPLGLPDARIEQDPGLPPGSVGLVASAHDLARIGQAFLDASAAVASPAARRAFFAPALADDSRSDRLLCAEAIRSRSGRLEGWLHAGRSEATGAELIVLTRPGIAIAIVSQASYDAAAFDALRPLLVEAAAPGLQLAAGRPKPPRVHWPGRLALADYEGRRLTLAPSELFPGALDAVLPDARPATLWPIDGTRATARRWVAADSRSSLELEAPLARATGREFEIIAHGRTVQGVLWQGVWYGAEP